MQGMILLSVLDLGVIKRAWKDGLVKVALVSNKEGGERYVSKC